MTSIGQQIVAARKAKGMTQDTLSKALHISRSAVAHWETERTIPDAEMLLKLSKVLDYSFEEENAKAERTGPQAQASEPEAPARVDDGSPAPLATGDATSKRPSARSVRRRIILGAAAAVALCACLALLLLPRGRTGPAQFKADDGTVYTIEEFQQETPREDGKAWLTSEKIVKIQSSEYTNLWMYTFVFNEMNGVGMKIDSIETLCFTEGKAYKQFFQGSALEGFDMGNEIPAHGEWRVTGGFPIQRSVIGVAIRLNGTDDNGAPVSFSSYLACDFK